MLSSLYHLFAQARTIAFCLRLFIIICIAGCSKFQFDLIIRYSAYVFIDWCKLFLDKSKLNQQNDTRKTYPSAVTKSCLHRWLSYSGIWVFGHKCATDRQQCQCKWIKKLIVAAQSMHRVKYIWCKIWSYAQIEMKSVGNCDQQKWIPQNEASIEMSAFAIYRFSFRFEGHCHEC